MMNGLPEKNPMQEAKMAKKKKSGSTSAEPEGKPVDMTGFILLQIIAYTNQVIMGCKEQLETEKKSAVLAHLQGQIPGCKFALSALKEQFKLNDDFMDNKNVCDYASLSFEQLLGAQVDIERMQAEEGWLKFLSKIEEKASSMKEFLLHNAKASRDLFVRQGMYHGMTTYKEVINQVDEFLNIRKTHEPLFNQEIKDDVPWENPGTDLVPTAGTEVAIRDQDLPEDDGAATDDDEDDFGDFPVESDPDYEF
jgi:hypothetical protein